jgi:hypothetical protein
MEVLQAFVSSYPPLQIIQEKCSHCGNDRDLSLQDGYTLCTDRKACSERALEIIAGRHLNAQMQGRM